MGIQNLPNNINKLPLKEALGSQGVLRRWSAVSQSTPGSLAAELLSNSEEMPRSKSLQ